MKPKIRIKLLDDNLTVISDRLVDQYTEFNTGPKDIHEGKLSIEFTIENAGDIESLKDYLDQLQGKVPIKPQETRGRKPKTSTKKTPQVVEVYKTIKSTGSIEKIIEYLQTLNFRFISYQYLEDLYTEGLIPMVPNTKDKHFMVRRYHTAVNPLKDKYDFSMMVAINLFNKTNEVKVYKDFKPKSKLKAQWTSTAHFKRAKEKEKPRSFPQSLSIEDRKTWRKIERKIEGGRKVPVIEEHFYYRYKQEIEALNN